MIDRFVFIRLAPEHSNLIGRAEAVDRLRRALADLPGLVRMTLGTPADDSASKWDLSLVLRFADRDALALAMGTVAWASVFEHMLPTRAVVIKAWTFDVADHAPSPPR